MEDHGSDGDGVRESFVERWHVSDADEARVIYITR